MADENAAGNSPMSTSEATPPHVDDSPEMVSQPSPPEEERVTSSTDCQPPANADSPGEPRVSSTSEQELEEGAGPSNPEPEESQSSPDPAPEIENPQPSPDDPPNPMIRELLEAPPQPSTSKVPIEAQSLETLANIITEAFKESLYASETKAAEDSQAGSSREITKKQNTGQKSDESNQQFGVEDLSLGSKPSQNLDLKRDSPPSVSEVHGEVLEGSGSSAKDAAGMKSGSYSKIGIAIEDKGSSGIDTTDVSLESELSASKTGAALTGHGTGTEEDVGLEREISPTKTSLTVPGYEARSTDEVGSKDELSPSKMGTSTSDVPEKSRDNVSPKRKHPTKVEHLSPKRNAPFTSPGSLRKKSESQMSTLLEKLDIEGTKDKPGSSKPSSEEEQKSMEIEESEKNRKGETEQEKMEVQVTDSQKVEDDTREKESEETESSMEVQEATKKDPQKDDSEKSNTE